MLNFIESDCVTKLEEKLSENKSHNADGIISPSKLIRYQNLTEVYCN